MLNYISNSRKLKAYYKNICKFLLSFVNGHSVSTSQLHVTVYKAP